MRTLDSRENQSFQSIKKPSDSTQASLIRHPLLNGKFPEVPIVHGDLMEVGVLDIIACSSIPIPIMGCGGDLATD